MAYQFDFVPVLANTDLLLRGALFTLELTAIGAILGVALGKVWPALSSQIIIVMLGSAVCSQIATEELSFAANFIQSRNFRAFETYALTTLVYLCMALMIRQLLNWIGRRFVMRNSR